MDAPGPGDLLDAASELRRAIHDGRLHLHSPRKSVDHGGSGKFSDGDRSRKFSDGRAAGTVDGAGGAGGGGGGGAAHRGAGSRFGLLARALPCCCSNKVAPASSLVPFEGADGADAELHPIRKRASALRREREQSWMGKPVTIFCRTLFLQVERAALHSYGPEPHSLHGCCSCKFP